MDLFKLNGKVAIVTGSSRGIGRSIAIQLARAGARVVISSRKLDACEEVVQTIRETCGDHGGEAMAIAANISDKAQVEALVAQTRAAWGGIDIMVCNAATNPYYGPMTGMSDEVFDKIMRNNVLSNAWLCNLAYPDMKARKNGAIVIVSSIGGLHGSPVIGAYNISKAADMQLARNLAVEWGPDNIRVNCIAPGLIRTDFAKALHENPVMKARVEGDTPLRRIGEPDDIGGIAVLLASAAGQYITGQTIVADGGLMIR
jgi:NAD(P)-dependent dehydrogenase (short-subunit alcohol dehydrogenase family)